MIKNFMDSSVVDFDMQDIYLREINWEKIRGRTILITGATGMIASYLVYFLLYLNEVHNMEIKICILVRNLAKCKERFGVYKENLQIYTDDINQLINIKEPVDFIIHAASLASPQYYAPMPVEVAMPNVLGTYYLLQFARQKGVKGFLFFSSGDIYGKMPMGTGDISENLAGMMDPLALHSCYGESKRMGETWCAAFAKEYYVPTKIVRIGHTYAPTMDIENDPRVFASFMRCVYYGEDIVMLSDGTAKRPFCYIADAVAAFFHVLFDGNIGDAYNVCNTKEFLSISELAKLMVGLRSDLNLKVIYKNRLESEVYLENKDNKENKPVEKKLQTLGWKCHYDTRKGFLQVLRYLQQKNHL